ncbi:MAG: DUF3046 domain-containing protein [Brevibacterium yomogidense]|uniref:DUF3046 domain-containing protein n=1 Tax=Brevibacterium yomogidense TaxID=946573 RepID=A0A1X6XMC8_9MICO|nr:MULTISPECIES: DUF3046 domain-containing protein [Brevibacterium]SLM99687.1 hypothetical protein FM105_11630 [Brevibacterium yomogidense]SMX69715.1 Protein of unknown function (DUF3046) [Brevibacterium sp. Mu109]
MRHALYWELMEDEFGRVRASSLHTDLALSTLGSRTPAQAFEAGSGPREVWAAVCDAAGVPEERRLGRDKPNSAPL